MKNNLTRRERERNETRLKIIDAARALFTAGGMEGMTLRELARRIEYSATTIYLHFANKEALVRELCAADFAVFSRRMINADRIAEPVERLRTVALAYVDFGLQYPSQYRAMFINIGGAPERCGHNHEVSPTKDEAAAPEPYDFLHAAAFKATAAGVLRPEYRDVALTTQVIWSGLHGVVSLHQTRARHPRVDWRPTPVAAETLVECLLNGLVAPPSAAKVGWRRE